MGPFLHWIVLAANTAAMTLSTECPEHTRRVASGWCAIANPYAATTKHGSWFAMEPLAALHPKHIDLGRYLFFDPILSGSQRVSCAHCHNPSHGYADHSPVSEGEYGALTERNSPTIWNVGLQKRLFWDGRETSLEKQLEGPLLSPTEMGTTKERVVEVLNGNMQYRQLFADAFARPVSQPIEFYQIALALASFERSLTGLNSPYDRYILGDQGDQAALTPDQLAGLQVFRSFLSRCSECHTPPDFSNHQLAVIGSPGSESRALKVPTLRNIGLTAPYMHRGQLATLEEVVDFYDEGGGRSQGMPKVHWHIRKIGLTDEEKRTLVIFLKEALTDNYPAPKIPTQVPSGLAVLE